MLVKALLDTYIAEMRATEHRLHMQVKGTSLADPMITQYVRDGMLTLNISERAAKMEVTAEGWVFHVRFGKVPRQVTVTPADIVGVYALHATAGRVVNLFRFDGNGVTFTGDGFSSHELLCGRVDRPQAETAKPKANHLKLVQ